MKRVNGLIGLLIMLLGLAACERESSELLKPKPMLETYVFLEVDQERIYQVDSILYDEFAGTVDTLRHWRKELIVGTFRDLENRLNYQQEIFLKNDSLSEWNKWKVRSLFINELRYEVLEDNLRIIKLTYPIRVEAKWDANALNTLNEQEYSYQSITAAANLNGVNYSNVLHVKQADEENLIEKRFAEEKYAPNLGLIFRRDLNIRTSFNGEILSGYDCRWLLMDSK
jgi:hypothetical protein